jgi:hypothetical protein
MIVRILHKARLVASWSPVAAVGAFIALYWQAASMYPGGTREHHETRGYSHLSNYWCDRLDHVSYSGSTNGQGGWCQSFEARARVLPESCGTPLFL